MSNHPNETIFELPPFPPLKIESGSLEGFDFFASWQGFKAHDEALDGKLRVVVIVEENAKTPTAAQFAAYRYLKENESLLRDALLAGLFADYPQIREAYEDLEPEYLPDIEQAEDFRRLIKPINIYINSESEGGNAYIGFEFDCAWEIEHGLGVMMHKDKYIGCNDAEAAWNLDLAQS